MTDEEGVGSPTVLDPAHPDVRPSRTRIAIPPPPPYSARVSRSSAIVPALLVAVGALVVLRVGLLAASPLDLHGDEAQYYAWSRELAAGYYSKPPLIAWIIAGSTALFGTGEWAVRMWSPLTHGLAALFVFAAGRTLFDARTGAWAALTYVLLPGIVVSSAVASTDALLLMFVALFLWAWAELRQRRCSVRWVYVLGLAAGLGVMSKYAMAFILVGFIGVLIADPESRKRVNLARALVVFVIVAAIVQPNIEWNLANDFATAGHTLANANLGAELLNPWQGAEFALSQLAVAGAALPLILWAAAKGWRRPDTRALAVFTLVPLAAILIQAVLSRANANWAASAYAPGALLVAAVCVRRQMWKWLQAMVGANALVALFLTVVALLPPLADGLGLANSFKRVRGWDETAAQLAARARESGARTVAVDNRITFYALDYYGGGEAAPLRAWQMEAAPRSHAELTRPLEPGAPEPILFVNYHREHLQRVKADFAELIPLPPLRVELGGGRVRELDLFLARGYRRAPRPLPSED